MTPQGCRSSRTSTAARSRTRSRRAIGPRCGKATRAVGRGRASPPAALPHKLASVTAGSRRCTWIPIEQIDNLYIGPIDNKLAGQPISLVDFAQPDFERFPKFREAIAHAEIAELEPGDTLYMPSL